MTPETPISALRDKVDFGIITIREDEFEAILSRLPVESFTRGKQTYALSTLQTSSGHLYTIASIRCPEQGNAVGQTIAHHLIEDLKPRWILVVGIGGTLPNDEHTLGDVVLASRLHDFSVSARVGLDNGRNLQEFEARGGPMHHEVQDLIGAIPALTQFYEPWNTRDAVGIDRPKVSLRSDKFYGPRDWQIKVRTVLRSFFGPNSKRDVPKVVTGSVVSSDTLVKDPELAKQWQSTARQVRAIEMELAGVYQAASVSHTPVLAIRGLSDVVGYRRSSEWTKYACNTAASFTLALLKSHPIPPRNKAVESKLPIGGETGLITAIASFATLPANVPALCRPERLYSNLQEVAYYSDTLYTAHTTLKRRNAVWQVLEAESSNPPDDWLLRDDTLYSFSDFQGSHWTSIVSPGSIEAHDSLEWAHSDDRLKTNLFVELLKKSLIEHCKTRDILYRHEQPLRFLYYAPTDDLSPRTVVTRSLTRDGSHTVFKGYLSKKTGEILYYRHHGLRFRFDSIDGKWYLRIDPTYHYTTDGFTVYPHYEELIKGIKAEEYNEAVMRNVLFWECVLGDDSSNFLQQSAAYPHLRLGNLMSFQFPFGIADDAWLKKESTKKKNSDQLDLMFDED